MVQESDIIFEEKGYSRPRRIIFTFLDVFSLFSGILEKVSYYADTCYIEFAGGFSLIINGCNQEFVSKLQLFIGEHIGIQHTDINGYEYIVRRMRNPRHYKTTKKRNKLEYKNEEEKCSQNLGYSRLEDFLWK
jgi:hypothetical protein